jgi:4-amino-4-deoxy-L-arabinose transferase-like glycosyltransferase
MYRLFPGSLLMLRLVPALAHAATVALTGETARLLGGGRWAQALSAVGVLTGPVFLAQGTLLSTDALQALSWLFCSYALIRVIQAKDERWWLALGVVAGIALLSKYMIAFWLAALGLGLIATPARRSLAHRPVYLGAALCALIVLPNILWQWAHDWPFLEIGRKAAEIKNVALAPLDFLHAEMREVNIATAPLWLLGIAAFAFWPRFRELRLFAIAFVALIALMIVLHAKSYYPIGAYPLLFAGGAVAFEAWIASIPVRAAYTAAVLIMGIVGAPFALPILPVERFVAYAASLHETPQADTHTTLGRLPQYYADMFGWPELAAQIGQVYQSLSPAEQSAAAILANNYGEAAAIDVLGAPWHLPPVISGHNNYFLWGPRGYDGSVVIRLGGNRETLLKTYASVDEAGVFESPWAMPGEAGKVIWICRGRHPPLDADWPSFKHYD